MAAPKLDSRLDTRISIDQRQTIDRVAAAANVPASWLVRWLLDQGLALVLPQGHELDDGEIATSPPRIGPDTLLEWYVEDRASGEPEGDT